MKDNSQVTIETLKNGLTVIIEEMPHFESVAYDLHIPGGLITEQENLRGSALILSELTERGAGGLDSQGLSESYDAIGARHSSSAGSDRYMYRGNVLLDALPEALRLLALQILEPALPDGEIQSIRELLLMDLRSLQDNPAQVSMVELTRQFLPAPFNRPGYGTEEGLSGTSHTALKKMWQDYFRPGQAILSVAGNCKKDEVLALVKKYFERWEGSSPALPSFTSLPPSSARHITMDSAQLQIALAYPSVKYGDADYYAAKVANEVLSGGMFGRLFMEVREKRGLCYSVHSRHSGGRYIGSVYAYAGTTPERAHETLSVMIEVLKNLKGTVTADELSRAKANLKAALVIGEESPGSRASSNAGDWWLGKRIRPLEEVSSAINEVTADMIDSYLNKYPPLTHALVTVGARELGKI